MSRAITILAVVALLAGCSLKNTPGVATVLPVTNLIVGEARLAVEVANDDAKRQQGLSGREVLPKDGGMLFVFDEPGRYEFWMKDMRFALDMLWLASGQVTEVTANVPAPSSATPEPVRIRPQQAVDMVIEVPAGWAAANRVSVGDQVQGLPERVDPTR